MRRTFFIIFFSLLSYACSSNPKITESGEVQVNRYFVFLNTNPNRPELPEDSVQTLQNLHMENIMTMASEGKLVLAGPFDGGGGLFLINAPDSATVWSYLNKDAAIVAGRFNIEMFPFSQNWGSICEVPKDATMKTYGFIRYKELMVDVITDNADQRRALGEAGLLLFSGTFGSTNAGIAILQTSQDSLLQTIASAHPGVSKGHLSADIRHVWMTEGVLCDGIDQ